MDAEVELRDVEAEDLDAPAQRRQATVGDSLAAVRAEARVEEVELREELVGSAVPVLPEPCPDGAEAPPVRLVDVLAGGDAGDVLGEPRVGRHERRRHAPRGRELANLPPVELERQRARPLERVLHRLGPGVRVAVRVASDPRSERERGRSAGQAPAQLADEAGRRLPEALLEEPEAVPDLVDDVRPA